MSALAWLTIGVVALGVAYVMARILAGPLRWLSLWLVRSIVAAAILWVLQWPTDLLGWHVGVNAWTALTVGALGLPGMALLFGLELALR